MADTNQQAEIAGLRLRLEEAEETIRAIRSGAVDAFVVEVPHGARVYTLQSADRPYRLLVEEMQQGALTLRDDGAIAYCNRRFADLVGRPLQRLIGVAFRDFIPLDAHLFYESLLQQGRAGFSQGESHVQNADGALVPVFLTLNALPPDTGAAVGLLVTDLTNEVRARLLKQAMSAREEEQRRIARDLHDGIGQSITSLLLGLCAAAEVPTFEEARARLESLRGITAALLDEVRRLARGLRPSVLDDLGLAAALEHLAAEYTHTHGIAVDVVAPDLALTRLPAEVETALYRIAQEALTNVLKHAAAKAVSLVVRRELGGSSGVHLTVEDDGRGFDSDARLQGGQGGLGLGLLDIRERAALLNGAVTIESRPGSGTTVHVYIPLS